MKGEQIIDPNFLKCPKCRCYRNFPEDYKNIKGRVIKTCCKCRAFNKKERDKAKIKKETLINNSNIKV